MNRLRENMPQQRLLIVVFLTLSVVAGLAGNNRIVEATYRGSNGRLAFGMNVDGNVDIYSALPNGRALQRLTSEPGFDACPAYSADGKWIVYCSDRTGAFEIWVMKENGTRKTQVTSMNGRATFPDFSPDGRKIAFTAPSLRPGATDSDIFVINTDGTGLVAITTSSSNDDFPVWSPDGTRIAFISDRSGLGQVWVMKADGSNSRQLTSDPGLKDQLPDWSPDGKKIAYENEGTGNGDIYVMNADGTNQKRLTTDPALDLAPVWSPDGKRIAFLRVNPNDRPIYFINADGSGQDAIMPGATQFAPAWQPYGNSRDKHVSRR